MGLEKAGHGLIARPALVKGKVLWKDAAKPMAKDLKSSKKDLVRETRQKRLAEALRENLKKRKKQPKKGRTQKT